MLAIGYEFDIIIRIYISTRKPIKIVIFITYIYADFPIWFHLGRIINSSS